MTTLNIRQKLHQFIDSIEDKKAIAIYTLLEDEIDVDKERRKLIMAEREKYFKGEGRSYSFEEIKDMATNKAKRNGI